MCWDVLQHRFECVGEQPCDALGWSIDVGYDGWYFNIQAGFVGLDEMVEPGQVGGGGEKTSDKRGELVL